MVNLSGKCNKNSLVSQPPSEHYIPRYLPPKKGPCKLAIKQRRYSCDKSKSYPTHDLISVLELIVQIHQLHKEYRYDKKVLQGGLCLLLHFMLQEP